MLNRRVMRGVPHYLVLLRGHTSADDEWLRLEELGHCLEKVAEYDAAAPRRRATRRAGQAAGPVVAPPAAPMPAPAPAAFPPVAPSGFRPVPYTLLTLPTNFPR